MGRRCGYTVEALLRPLKETVAAKDAQILKTNAKADADFGRRNRGAAALAAKRRRLGRSALPRRFTAAARALCVVGLERATRRWPRR